MAFSLCVVCGTLDLAAYAVLLKYGSSFPNAYELREVADYAVTFPNAYELREVAGCTVTFPNAYELREVSDYAVTFPNGRPHSFFFSLDENGGS